MAASESLLFDGNRVQEEQEEELKQEEDERQQQLKDLLANAFDDIDADETCSFHSDDSHDSGRHSDEIGQRNQWNENKFNQHASTPVSETRAPPLITPMIQRRYSSPAVSTPPLLQKSYSTKQNGDTMYQEPEYTAVASYDGNMTQQSDNDSMAVCHQQQHLYQQHKHERANGSYPSSHSSHHSSSDGNPRHYNTGASIQHSPMYHKSSQEHLATVDQLQGYAHDNNHYSNPSSERHLTGSSDMDSTMYIDSGNVHRTSKDNLQDLYFKEGAGSKTTHIEILYQAKSRQLQELQEKYELSQLESSKELRILRHEVALLEGAKQGCESSLKQTQALLAQNKDARFELQKKLDAVEDMNKNVVKEKDQLREELSAAEASIESLNAQIFALGSSDTVERMREQHESIVNSLRREQEMEKHELNQQIASIRQQLHSQSEEMDSSRLALKADMDAIAKERIDHAESINRLTNSLKESQRQIQELLNDSCGTELSKLRIQLQQCSASKTVTEQLCESLQKEIGDLKEQVSLYERAHTIQSLFTAPEPPNQDRSTEAYDDTLVELGIKQPNRTTVSKPTSDTRSSDETILILRRELQTCLSVLKEKRQELSALRSHADQKNQSEVQIQTELQLVKGRLEKAQMELKERDIELHLYKSAARDGNSLIEVKLRSQLDALTKEKATLEKEIECLTERLQLVASNEAKLEEINAELNTKICEMVDDFDRDKKAALDRCQETLETHNQTVREMLRSELQTEFQMKVERAKSQYESELVTLRKSNESLKEELGQVKELYVQVCSEKTGLEEESCVQLQNINQLQSMIEEVEQLKRIWSQQETEYRSKLKNLEEAVSKLEQEKTTLQETIDQLTELLEHCRNDKDVGRDGVSQNSSALSACRELFSNSQSVERCKSNNQSLERCPSSNESLERCKSNNQSLERNGRLSSNSSRVESSQTRWLEEQLRNEKKERADLQNALLKTRASHGVEKSDLEAEVRRLEQQLGDTETKLDECKTELVEVNREMREQKVLLDDLRSDNQKLDKLLSSERVQLSLSRDDVVTLQNQLSELKLKLSKEEATPNQFEEVCGRLDECRRNLDKVKAELEAESVCHSQAKEELVKLRSCLTNEKEAHCVTNKKIVSSLQDLQAERKLHQQTKATVNKKEAELQAEITCHNQTKIDLSKVKAELAEVSSKNNDLVEKSEYVRVQAELESEQNAHQITQAEKDRCKAALQKEVESLEQTKAELNQLHIQFSAIKLQGKNLVNKSELTNVHIELETERLAHQKTKAEVDRQNVQIQAETLRMNELKAQIEKMESELSVERKGKQEMISVREFVSVQSELESERRTNLLAKAELQREKEEAVAKLQTQVSEANEQKKSLVGRIELEKVEVELQAERKSHDQTKQKMGVLESNLNAERTSQSLAKSSALTMQSDLSSERAEHQQTQLLLAKLERDLDTEQSNHSRTKMELVTLETELSTERSNQGELRKSLERLRCNHSEQETEMELMRTRQSQDAELISQLRTQRSQEKGQLEGLKASHSQVLSDLSEAKAELIRKLSELSQQKASTTRLLAEIDSLKEKHNKEKERLVEHHAASLQSGIEEAKLRWTEESTQPALDMSAENKRLKEKLNSLEADVTNYEKLLSQADQHFEQQLNKIRLQMEEEHGEEVTKLTKAADEAKRCLETEKAQSDSIKSKSERELKELQQKVSLLTNKANDLTGKCRNYQACAEDLRRNLKSMSAQTDLLKSTNKKLQAELSKSNTTWENKVECLSNQLQSKDREMQDAEHEHGLTVQSLKQKMIAMKNEQVLQTPRAKVESTSCGCQTVSADAVTNQQYNTVIRNIRADVLTYVEETNRNAAKLIKCEIHKAKQVTARQLRNYYVKCFKQSLHDNRSTYEEKLSKLERTLDNAVAATVTPPNINTDSIFSAAEQLFTDSLRFCDHSEVCPDHSLGQVYSRGPTPIVMDRGSKSISARRQTSATAMSGRAATPTSSNGSGRTTPIVTDNDSKYSYVPLRHATISTIASVNRNRTPVPTYNSDTSENIIRELGLNNTETSPPRWYNPPPEKLDPSPDRRQRVADTVLGSQLAPVESESSSR